MTREAKIGMLTGLGVILLIGVLLSDYLGDSKGVPPTARMAALPVGAQYRQEVMQPVVPPGMAPAQSAESVTYAANTAANTEVVAAYASTATSGVPVNGPTVSRAVTPEAVGPAPARIAAAGAPPTITLADPAPPSLTMVAETAVAKPVANTTYMIAAGDTLIKIARKFYGSDAKQSDLQRIVAANPSILKDANTTLVVGKKLVITNVPAAAVPASPKPVQAVVALKSETDVIPMPGASDTKTNGKQPTGAVQIVSGKKEAKTYVVQAGDTLEKIARKFAPSNSSQLVSKLKTANGIKDPTALQVGTTLKVPV